MLQVRCFAGQLVLASYLGAVHLGTFWLIVLKNNVTSLQTKESPGIDDARGSEQKSGRLQSGEHNELLVSIELQTRQTASRNLFLNVADIAVLFRCFYPSVLHKSRDRSAIHSHHNKSSRNCT